ncbi:DUF4358 domain-containing protein [Bacillus sp. S/N-304-OC-R1]|uniref:DUF4358 domain-containing protein n=1 Tax=Bacillus sp. S/N-304-OC-R1 TaxID=2758034 RepID=UPI001C8D3CBD|nr:DUF4358 domain-containing protein [Bacillus sp. S/N-304-OC-R1]MBY0123572.1 DUF4358 domain-containing protein [Bacillus sp. S/N-304-OC-R1]
MKKGIIVLMLTIVLGVVVTACSSNKEAAIESKLPVKEMVEQMVKKVPQPAQIELKADEVKTFYHLDPAKLEEYEIRFPMMNVKTNEIAILKVKDAKDVLEVESAVKQRAEDVKKQFEMYLPDQYENAKNYKLITKGNYILLVISEEADELVKVYDSFFDQK